MDFVEENLRELKESLKEIDECIEAKGSECSQDLLDVRRDLLESIKELEDVQDDGDSESQSTRSEGSSGEESADNEFLESALDEMEKSVMEAVKKGQQKETVHFADWEAHGRGVASKLMAKMGYVKGKGLGKNKQGIADVIVTDQKQPSGKSGLGTERALDLRLGKKKKRGGRRESLRKKARLEAKQRMAEDSEAIPVFNILNKVLVDPSPASVKGDQGVQKESGGGGTAGKTEEESAMRARLVKQQELITTHKKKIELLNKAIRRNSSNQSVSISLKSRLDLTKASLLKEERTFEQINKSVQRSSDSKKSMKF